MSKYSVPPFTEAWSHLVDESLATVSEKHQEAAYAAYKSYLATARTRSYQGVRAGGRKQEALNIVSSRYKLPVSTVKNIVRECERLNSVVHIRPENYVKWLKFHEEAEKLLSAGLPSVCPVCENTPSSVTNSVAVRPNPKLQVEGEYEAFVSCFICFMIAEGKLDVLTGSVGRTFPDSFVHTE